MENKNTIGCSAGRAKIVDPNDFDGFKSSDNVPVQLEDLNISVKLTAFRKGRTLLTGEVEGGNKDNVSQISVNFLEGSELGGKKVLTTSYTDLTTRFESDITNDETLGITNIDIEFNASMAPMITINFVDVRGSAIFQNEENIINNKGNKYTTFFQLPYPMFELEIKGYYGMPVKYCLHMLKFNSKFNSKTGNFELTANFIGYTYALMSDMLLGYLKAIPFTRIGGEQFNKYNETFTNGNKVLKLSELSLAISKLNEGLKKEVNENPASKVISAVKESTDELDKILSQINQLGQNFDLNKEKDEYKFIIYNNNNNEQYTETQKNALENQYKSSVKESIIKFNKLNEVNKLNESDFLNIEISTNLNGGKLYKNVTLEELKSTTNDSNLNLKLGNPSNIDELKQRLVKHIASNNATTDIGLKASLNIFDMTPLFDIIGKFRKSLEVSEKDSKVKLAKAFQEEVRDIIGFEPTTRTIIECYTAAIETFIETIFIVSESASKSDSRKEELSKKFKDDEEGGKNSDMLTELIKNQEFFPWPDYREKDTVKNSYVDKYLGASDVLEFPEKVDELVFIDDLVQAFRKATKLEQEAVEAQEKNETTWNPVSPYDTAIFSQIEPYERAGDLTTLPDVLRLMVIRAMIFLGYSNDPSILTDEEIIGMGASEVNNMLRAVKDPVIRQSLTQINLEFIKNITGSVNGKDNIKVVEKSKKGKGLFYNYIYNTNNEDDFKVLPLNQKFNKGTWGDPTIPKIKDDLVNERDNQENFFLTNYSSAKGFTKLDDGGINIKILDSLPTPITLSTIPEGVPTETKMNLKLLSQLNVDSTAGYNSFNPNYGIQEFKDMDWGDETLDGLPLMYVFYRNCDTGLANTSKVSGIATNLISKINENGYLTTGDKLFNYTDNPNGNKLHKNLGLNRILSKRLLNGGSSNISYPYIDLKFASKNSDGTRETYDDNSFSLFGSEFYYQQSYAEIIYKQGKYKISCADYSRAFLFLQSLPFNTNQLTSDPFGNYQIKHLFDKKAGIIHAPRIWCAYIGSMLWRLDKSDPIIEDGKLIDGGSGVNDPIVWSVDYSNGDINKSKYFLFDIPDRFEKHFPTFLNYTRDLSYFDYPDMKDSDIMLTLPEQVKNEFKKIFFDFVNGDKDNTKSWLNLSDKLEIFDTSYKTSGKDFNDYIKEIRVGLTSFNPPKNSAMISGNLNGKDYKTRKDNILKYYSMIELPKYAFIRDFYLHLELKDGYGTNDVVTTLIDIMIDEVFIINNNYKIWKEVSTTSQREPIIVDESKFDIYFKSVMNVLSGKTDEYNISKQNENLDIAAFGTSNKDIIRLQLYRNCKNIYDKWLGGAKNVDNLVFQCGGTRSSVDNALAKKYENSKTRMIDSFRFVTRNFRDIGNELYINPIPINNTLIGNPNSSAYESISSILASNNFNFQALPNFINFNDDKNLEAIFKPYNYSDGLIKDGSCGPAFVCVYDGQASKHLDLKDGNYPNDGFDLRCMNGGVDVSVPTDFTSEKYAEYEDPISTFMVRYSQQNQNIFKDIDLDQSEFSETDESIQIQDEISQKGSQNNRAIVGQNIYNVYAVRSYTAKVEMMGNAMIQPMMYFQLDNIPMFHGAYLITKVSHSIKPNSMFTNFTGTRIRYPETPLISAYDIYMDILETMDLSSAGTGTVGGGVNGEFEPIVTTLIENSVSNAYIYFGKKYGQITTKKINLTGIPFGNNVKDSYMISEAADALTVMLKEWVKWMKDQGFKTDSNGNYGYVSSLYRDYSKQSSLAKGQKTAAAAGTSYHGWGLAVDMSWVNRNGKIIKFNYKEGSSPDNFDYSKNPAIEWLYNNSFRFGFMNPSWARDSSGYDEAWHWEYHGKSAMCLINKNPNFYGKKIDTNNKSYDSVVKNPKTLDGKEAVYTGCEKKYIKRAGDGFDGQTIQKTGCPPLLTNGTNTIPSKELYIEIKNITKLNDFAVAGIMGNLFRESNFKPQAYNSLGGGCGAYGLIQWRGDRLKKLNELANSSKSTIDDYKVQLNFLNSELKNTWKYTLAELKKVTSAEDAAKIFSKTYEGGNLGQVGFNLNDVLNGTYDTKRVEYAKKYYNQIVTKNFV